MEYTEINRVVDGGLSGFQRGVKATGGELQVNSVIPAYMKQGDAIGAFTEERAVEGYYPVNVPYSELADMTWLHGRVLLLGDKEKGFLPTVVLPDPKGRQGFVRIVQFNQPYDPTNGIDEGQLLALSFETTTKEDAGFGSHEVQSPFEGGHFAAATLASKLEDQRVKVDEHGHTGAHDILDGSVVDDFSRARLTGSTGNAIPLPKTRDLDITRMPAGARFKANWHDKLLDKGRPVVAAHPEAAKVLLGTVIENLGTKGLDEVGNYITAVREEK